MDPYVEATIVRGALDGDERRALWRRRRHAGRCLTLPGSHTQPLPLDPRPSGSSRSRRVLRELDSTPVIPSFSDETWNCGVHFVTRMATRREAIGTSAVDG